MYKFARKMSFGLIVLVYSDYKINSILFISCVSLGVYLFIFKHNNKSLNQINQSLTYDCFYVILVQACTWNNDAVCQQKQCEQTGFADFIS